MRAASLNFNPLYDFRRAAMPFLLLGAAFMSGCSTTGGLRMDLDSCEASEFSETSIGNAEKRAADEGGAGVKADIGGLPRLKFTSSRALGEDESCRISGRIVNAGLMKDPETGKFRPGGLAMVYRAYNDPDVDPKTRLLIKKRTLAMYGFTPEDIPKIAKAQREGENPQPPPEPDYDFICRQDGPFRKCKDVPRIVPGADPAPAAK